VPLSLCPAVRLALRRRCSAAPRAKGSLAMAMALGVCVPLSLCVRLSVWRSGSAAPIDCPLSLCLWLWLWLWVSLCPSIWLSVWRCSS
jgi:hypothetical protein